MQTFLTAFKRSALQTILISESMIGDVKYLIVITVAVQILL